MKMINKVSTILVAVVVIAMLSSGCALEANADAAGAAVVCVPGAAGGEVCTTNVSIPTSRTPGAANNAPPGSDSSSAVSANDKAKTDPSSTYKTARLQQINKADANNYITAFDGWSSAYDTYSKSPMLFEVTGSNPTNEYPQVTDKRHGWRSMETLNMGVYDEIRKAYMPVFQSIHALEADSANDANDRDRYLDLFKSIRGIAVLTLSYLDKTVAAGLSTVSEQISSRATNHLLKQISKTNARIAEPQHAQLYRDVDEKITFCMMPESRQGNQSWSSLWGGLYRQFPSALKVPGFTWNGGFGGDPSVCVPKCGERPTVTPTGATHGTGLYSWCVCCSEMLTDGNKTVWDTLYPDGTFSLVDRIFFGNRLAQLHTGGISGVASAAYVRGLAANFKDYYGDILFYKDPNHPSDTMRYEYRYPSLSVKQKIELLRNGCESTTTGYQCDSSTNAKPGICPATKEIVKNWPPREQNMEQMQEWWVEASLGKVLTGKDVEDWYRFSNQTYPVPPNWEPKGEMLRFIEAFCDASAVVAFKRLHVRFMSMIEDHIVINQHASEYDKARVRTLMSRVSRQLDWAEADKNAEEVVVAQLAAARTEAEAKRIGDIASSTNAWQNSFRLDSRQNKPSAFSAAHRAMYRR